MTATARDDYDAVLYPGYAYPQTHPDRLATIAALFGVRAAPVAGCRVLELGCGDGANLIPMAFALPESQFVGVDLAGRAVASGEQTIKALGLKNITLRRADVMALGRDFGEFDYIIAHGLYSWVPADVQDRVLAIADANLAANGIAYVSYNAYPGCHLREMVREMMLFHVRTCQEPQPRINQALAFVRFLAESESNAAVVLRDELEHIRKRRREVLFHDDLAPFNSPLYFYEFAQRAARHGLQYLAEADLYEMYTGAFSPATLDLLRQIDDSEVILKEQYMDFLKCRRFRQTLLCHHGVAINRALDSEVVRGLYVEASVPPASAEPDIRLATVEEFRTAKGTMVATDHPLSKAALLHLSDVWPRALHFRELFESAQSLTGDEAGRLNRSAANEAATLAEILLKLYAAGVVELRTHAPQFATTVSARPQASRLARLQAARDRVVTNLCHASVRFEDEIGLRLLQLLDGSRDRAALINDLNALQQSSRPRSHGNGQPAEQAGGDLSINTEELEKNLAKLARLALLVA